MPISTATSAAMSMTSASTSVAVESTAAVAMDMDMRDSGSCKLSVRAQGYENDISYCRRQMLLNWHTRDACFLTSSFHVRTPFTFFLACLASFFLVISLEFLRRCQRKFDKYLRSKNTLHEEREKDIVLGDELEQKLLGRGSGDGVGMGKKRSRTAVVVLEQLSRGAIPRVPVCGQLCYNVVVYV